MVVSLEQPGEYDSEEAKAKALANVQSAFIKHESTVSVPVVRNGPPINRSNIQYGDVHSVFLCSTRPMWIWLVMVGWEERPRVTCRNPVSDTSSITVNVSQIKRHVKVPVAMSV